MDKELGRILFKVKSLGYVETQVISNKKYLAHPSGLQVKLDPDNKMLTTLDNKGYSKDNVPFSILNNKKIEQVCEIF